MDANIKFKLKANAFNRMTGMVAPGKDAWQGPSRKERQAAWNEWIEKYGTVIEAILSAIDNNHEFISG